MLLLGLRLDNDLKLEFENNFENGYYTIISFSLFSILAISKFTKHPL